MTKEQCEAIIYALQAGCEYLASTYLKIGVGANILTNPSDTVTDLTTGFETTISGIIADIPDDQNG